MRIGGLQSSLTEVTSKSQTVAAEQKKKAVEHGRQATRLRILYTQRYSCFDIA